MASIRDSQSSPSSSSGAAARSCKRAASIKPGSIGGGAWGAEGNFSKVSRAAPGASAGGSRGPRDGPGPAGTKEPAKPPGTPAAAGA
eukprot:709355-Hanusia_phi.AAC.1